MKKCLLFLLLIPLLSFGQLKKEVLFIGNSYTYVNNLPNLVKEIALSFGDTLVHDSSTPGGSNFNSHTTNTQTLSKINQQQWDYVVLQAQSQEPSFSPSQVVNDTYPYAEILVDSIHENSNCTEPLFFMTWGRKYGDQQNCQFYPPICTYSGMQQRLRESYLEMAFIDSASCAPVGMAWKKSIAIDSAINLYSSDNSHPSIYGSYLAACTFYASIFKKSALGSSYWPNAIDSATAYSLQQIGSSTVLDSLSIWNIFNADFSLQQYNDSIICTNLSSNYNNVLWDFGDGITSFNENPTHLYTNSGTYILTLFSFSNQGCLVDSQSVNIYVSFSIPSWDCVNGACIDPLTGNGQYPTFSNCVLDSCIVIPPVLSWDCDLMTGCYDPGTGAGTYADSNICQAACVTSIKAIELNNISIFPNPSTGIFNLSFNSENNQDLRLRIFNPVGEELLIDYLVEFTPKDTKQINLKNYDKGIYFLEIKITNKIINKKLILN